MKALEKLQSSNAVLAVLVLALLAQMPHAQHVFFNLGSDLGWFGWVQSWFGAVALEFAVLVFVVRGKQLESWGFAVFSIAVNMVYYYDPAVALWVPRATWLLSAGLPVAIALYSHEVAGKHASTVEVEAVDSEVDTCQPSVDLEVATVDAAVAVDNWPVATVDTPVAECLPVAVDVNQEVDSSQLLQLANQLLQQHDGDRATVAVALSNQGYKGVDIASTLGVHKTQVSRWLKKG